MDQTLIPNTTICPKYHIYIYIDIDKYINICNDEWINICIDTDI